MSPTLVHSLWNSVRHSPGAEAIVHRGERVSYAQLWREATAVATMLERDGLRVGDRVAILMENSPHYVAVYYGALMAGGAVVALNTAAKARDFVNWINHCGAAWLVADAQHPELAGVVEQLSPDVFVALVGENKPVEAMRTVSRFVTLLKDDLREPDFSRLADTFRAAAIIYTSGTTGQPKGVTLSHRNLASNVASILQYLKLRSDDRVLNVLPFYYSYGNSVLHTHLAVGAACVLENSLAYPHKILSIMHEEAITGFSGVPSTYAVLMSRSKLSDYDLSSLRYLTQAGGAMPPASIKRVLQELPHVEFFVMYGQTEATARLSYLPPENLERKLGAIGVGIPGVTLTVRDSEGLQSSSGVTGEIWASGDNIMLGYWRDPDTTSTVLQDGWLKTGDLAYMDDDGYLYIVGRASEMIKSGAHRIAPKEIEEVIMELDQVAEVAVVGVTDELMGQVVKAFVVPRLDAEIDARRIMAHCRAQLAMYKIPKQIEFVAGLPKTASGKLQRFKLTEPSAT
jgi:acyl-CoA synthetase (AMP-forming)/AMP-acid ligase II